MKLRLDQFLQLNKWAGMCPFDLEKNDLTLNKKSVYFSIIFLLGMSTFVGYGLIYIPFKIRHDDEYNYNNGYYHGLLISLYVTHVSICLLKKDQFRKIFILIEEMEANLGPLDGRHFDAVTYVLSSPTIIYCLVNAYRAPYIIGKINQLLYIFDIVYLLFVNHELVWLLTVVIEGYERLNVSLKNSWANMFDLLILNNKNIQYCELINECFGPHFIILFSSSFILTTLNSYIILNSSLEFKIQIIIWNVSMIIYCFTMVYYCEKTVRMKIKFEYLFHDRAVKDAKYNNKKATALLVGSTKIKFTACSFFNVDYSIFSSMASACITYLVLLLQFKVA